jgi:hypothetical protein
MPYDDREAKEILFRARYEHSQSAREASRSKRLAAAKELLDALQKLLESAGYNVGNDKDGGVKLAIPDVGAVWLGDDGDGNIHARSLERYSGNAISPPTKAKIEWDPVAEEFRGTAPDTFVTPVPGEPARRRPALAVLADLVSEAIRYKSSHRSGTAGFQWDE